MSSNANGNPEGNEQVIMSTHCSHCHGTCLLKVHVKNGAITRIESDDGEEPQYRACARGRAYRQRVYAPDRLTQPLRRIGERGEGKFACISWDDALDTVAGELRRVKETYGPASILFSWSGGDMGRLQGQGSAHARLLFMAGGCSQVWASPSAEGAMYARQATFGTKSSTNTRDNLLHSRLIILWGCNPAETTLLNNTMYYLIQAKEKGTKIVSVDPRFTNTAALCANQWVPIRPGTDAAMLLAMAYVMIEEGLPDRKFLDTYTVGFDKFHDYVMGAEDGIGKTPRWAEGITGVPAKTIADLAKEYAAVKPAALLAGISAGRTAFGEQYHRTAATLAAMTGNIGTLGGDAGISIAGISGVYPFLKLGPGLPIPSNPVESQAPPRKNTFPASPDSQKKKGGLERCGQIHHTKIADALLKGKAGGYPADYRLLYLVNTNYPNQYANINKCVKALKSQTLEFLVSFEQFMTPAAKFADIILPVNTCLERNDITTGPSVGFYGFMGKAIDSVGASRSHFEICTALAERLGIKNYSDKTEDEWLRQIALGSPEIRDYEAFKKAGGHKIKRDKPYIAFEREINEPESYPFPTPSGKIEIYSQQLADMNDPLLPPIPKYIETWESPNDALARKYPLQLITTHYWRRAHSQYDNIPWLRELESQAIKINSLDAEVRGIKNGDLVKVFNDRGMMVIAAKITERIMPGVVDIPQGAWYAPDENGMDKGGSANVLTRDEHSPGGAFPGNTSLVQVQKV